MKQAAFWKQIKFVTGNRNKVREASAILGAALDHVKLELDEIQTCDVEVAVRHKAEQAFQTLNTPVLVEDSGLAFSAWNGLPGALVKWFEKTAGLGGMVTMLNGFQDRKAQAICIVGLHDGTTLHLGYGLVEGEITKELKGQGGFGWDAIFVPEGETRTYGEMSGDEKNAISHRKRAFEDLKKKLDRL